MAVTIAETYHILLGNALTESTSPEGFPSPIGIISRGGLGQEMADPSWAVRETKTSQYAGAQD